MNKSETGRENSLIFARTIIIFLTKFDLLPLKNGQWIFFVEVEIDFSDYITLKWGDDELNKLYCILSHRKIFDFLMRYFVFLTKTWFDTT